MQTISTDTEAAIVASAQEVIPRVTVEWLNSRFVESLVTYSSSDNYLKKTLDMDPIMFLQLNEPEYEWQIMQDHPLCNLWMLNDTSGTVATDSNSLANGTYTGGFTLNSDSKVTDQSTLFNGSTGYVTVPHSTRFSPGYFFGFMTVEAWINLDTVASNQTIMGKGDTDGAREVDDGYEWKFRVSSTGKLEFYILYPDETTYVVATGTTTIAASSWYHVVATWDGKVIKLYLNGDFEGSGRLETGFLINTPMANTSALNIGRMPDASEYLDGYMNAVALYNVVLSPTEIAGHYNIGVGRAYDYSRNANVGNWVFSSVEAVTKANTVDTENRLFQGRYYPVFTGLEYLAINNIDGTEDFVIEVWAQPDAILAPASEQTIVAKGTQGTPIFQWGIDVAGDSTDNWFEAYVYNTAGTRFEVTSDLSPDYIDQMNHLLLVVSNDVLHLYVNGIDNGDTATVTGTRSTSSLPIAIGRWGSGATPQLFEGQIANVAFYPDLTMDAKEVYARYRSTTKGASDDANFGPSFMTGDEAINALVGYGHVWPVLGAKDIHGTTMSLSSKYDIAEDTTQDRTYRYEYGWWHNIATDSGGDADLTGVLVMSFDTLTCNGIHLKCPDEFGTIKNYTLSYKNTSNVWVSVGNIWELQEGLTEIRHQFGIDKDIKGIAIEILSTWIPFDYPKISELGPYIRDDVSEDIVTFSIQKTKEDFDSSVPFGATAANSATVELQNVELRYNPNNTDSDLYGLLTPDAQFEIALGWTGGGPDGLLLEGS
jgi:hypothetical protein